MVPTVVVERVGTPGGEMVLSRRGDEFSIRVGSVELMNSRSHASEDELGRVACQRIAAIASPRMLVGGLGLGYTLRAALDALPATAVVDVVELVPAVVRWNRTILGFLAGHPLDDPRVHVIEDDVAHVIERAAVHYPTGLARAKVNARLRSRARSVGLAYHAILLDVDNGPDRVFETNAALYRRAGLAAAGAALAPGGVLAVWSSFESATFTAWLRDVGFSVDVQSVKRRGGPRHYIWFATRR